MLVPKLRFKREDGTDYPEWEEKRVGDILTLCHGKDYKHLENGNIPVMGTGGIITYVNQALCDWECVCIGRKGTIDKPYYMNKPFWSVDTLFYSKPLKNNLPKFQYYLFQNINWQLYNEASGVPSLSASTIESVCVSIPNIEEQQKIADFLSAVDEVIVQSEAEVQNLKQQKKAAMQKIFSQEVRFKCEDGTDYPEWEEKKMSELFNISAGGDVDKSNSSSEQSDDYPYAIYANSLTNNGLYGYANYYKVEQDCFTVTGRGDIGYAVSRHEKFVPVVRLLVCVPKHNENVDCFAEIVNNTSILVESTGVPQLTSIQLGKIRIIYPAHLEEQKKIADFLSAVDEAISYAKQELEKWKVLKKGLLQQMFV